MFKVAYKDGAGLVCLSTAVSAYVDTVTIDGTTGTAIVFKTLTQLVEGSILCRVCFTKYAEDILKNAVADGTISLLSSGNTYLISSNDIKRTKEG